MAAAIAEAIMAEEAGDVPQLITDPSDLESKGKNVSHERAVQVGDPMLRPFGLGMELRGEVGGDGSSDRKSHIVVKDGGDFVEFLQGIEPADIDNPAIEDEVDPRWRLRDALSSVVDEVYRDVRGDLVKVQPDNPSDMPASTLEVVAYGQPLASQLGRLDLINQNEAKILREVQAHATGGIAPDFVTLAERGLLNKPDKESPALALGFDPGGDEYKQMWADLEARAQGASERNPELASTWPTLVREHHAVSTAYLNDPANLRDGYDG